MIIWLVVTGWHFWHFPRNIGLLSSSQLTNSIIFQRGGPGPPTSLRCLLKIGKLWEIHRLLQYHHVLLSFWSFGFHEKCPLKDATRILDLNQTTKRWMSEGRPSKTISSSIHLQFVDYIILIYIYIHMGIILKPSYSNLVCGFVENFWAA